MNKTSIEWTDYSVNPFKMQMPDGTLINVCVHKSDGCRNCYAEMIVRRWWKKEWGEFPGYTAALLRLGKPVLVESELRAVLRLSQRIAEGKADPEENKVFWNDMTDEYLEFWPDEFLEKVWQVRYDTKNLIHQVLTKRPDRMLDWISRSMFLSNAPLENVWLGVSVEDQRTANERIPLLLETPAAVRWLSVEPLLSHVDLEATPAGDILNECYECGGDGCEICGRVYGKLDWIVTGGESGQGARPMHPDWVRSLRDQCVDAKVPFFFKQWGAWANIGECDDPCGRCVMALRQWNGSSWRGSELTGTDWEAGSRLAGALQLHPIGKKKAGRLVDGREWNEYPSGISNLESGITQEAAA